MHNDLLVYRYRSLSRCQNLLPNGEKVKPLNTLNGWEFETDVSSHFRQLMRKKAGCKIAMVLNDDDENGSGIYKTALHAEQMQTLMLQGSMHFCHHQLVLQQPARH